MRSGLLLKPICLLLIAAACHAAAAQTASAPSPSSPPAPPAATATASWTGKDTQGRDVVIPADKKVTLLAFLRPGQSQSDEVIKVIGGLRDRTDIQLVGVVSGDDAADLGRALAAAKWNGPIIADTNYVLSGQLGVKVWPTTVVLSSKAEAGAIQGHIGGLPATFNNDLSAYVDFAAGKLDRAGLDKALANRGVVAETTDARAARHVEVAMRLAAKGSADEAQDELTKALEFTPTDGSVLLNIARVNLMINRPKEAGTFLAKIKEGQGVTAGEKNVLAGWAAVELEQWVEARKILTDAVALNPDPSEAYYLLARVCEHDGQTAKAAEYYRKAFEKSESGKQMGTPTTTQSLAK